MFWYLFYLTLYCYDDLVVSLFAMVVYWLKFLYALDSFGVRDQTHKEEIIVKYYQGKCHSCS
jgi:hypothetical protein